MNELAGVVSLGLLADETVLAIGRLLRHEALGSREHDVLLDAKGLLESLGSAEVPLIQVSGWHHLHADPANGAVFRAARIQAPNEPVRAILNKFAAALEIAIAENGAGKEPGELRGVQELFGRVGELSLARTSAIAEERRPLKWTKPEASSPY